MNLRRALPAGLVDAGFASLATFGIGLLAARQLGPSALGTYALFFTALNLAAVVPTQLVLVPYEVRAVVVNREDRLRILGRSLWFGLGTAFVAALTVPLAGLAVADQVPTRVFTDFALTATACAVVSPVQDHLRRVLHLCGLSWHAAVTSVVQFIIAATAVVAMPALGAPATLVPFGALVLANVVSMVVGLALASGKYRRAMPVLRPGYADLARSGGWLLIYGLLPPGANYLVSVIITALAGAAVLGYSEAGRIVGHPILVFSLGLSTVLGPRSMEAGARGQKRRAHQVSRFSNSLTVLFGLGYVGLFGFTWFLNPLAHLVPNAFQVTGLVAAVGLGNVLVGLSFPQRSELNGAGRERVLAACQTVTCLAQVLVAFSVSVTGVFAKPLAQIVFGAVLWGGQSYARRTLYAKAEPLAGEPVSSRVNIPG